jgi:hypothetical protein
VKIKAPPSWHSEIQTRIDIIEILHLLVQVSLKANGLLLTLQSENLRDLLNLALYTSQSFMAITLMLYCIRYKEKETLDKIAWRLFI